MHRLEKYEPESESMRLILLQALHVALHLALRYVALHICACTRLWLYAYRDSVIAVLPYVVLQLVVL